jgi:hypothetical protein
VSNTLVEPMDGDHLSVSLDKRHTAACEILLVFNESWKRHEATLRFVRNGGVLARLDPMSGERDVLKDHVVAGDTVTLDLAPTETLILTLNRA